MRRTLALLLALAFLPALAQSADFQVDLLWRTGQGPVPSVTALLGGRGAWSFDFTLTGDPGLPRPGWTGLPTGVVASEGTGNGYILNGPEAQAFLPSEAGLDDPTYVAVTATADQVDLALSLEWDEALPPWAAGRVYACVVYGDGPPAGCAWNPATSLTLTRPGNEVTWQARVYLAPVLELANRLEFWRWKNREITGRILIDVVGYDPVLVQ